MTRAEALQEARRRWSRCQYLFDAPQAGESSFIVAAIRWLEDEDVIGDAGIPETIAYGVGVSWAEAFADADRREQERAT